MAGAQPKRQPRAMKARQGGDAPRHGQPSPAVGQSAEAGHGFRGGAAVRPDHAVLPTGRSTPAAARRVLFPDRALQAIHAAVEACEQCPRLRRYCTTVAQTKRRAYFDQEYWGRPVPGFGDPAARLWLVGLAPGAHGANRTGRMFTGDSSGDWLFGALHRAGFAREPYSRGRNDGQQLRDAYVSAAARCAPPGNKPLPAELARCRTYLEAELQVLTRLRVIVPLGKIAFDAVLRLLGDEGCTQPSPRPRFGHGVVCRVTLAAKWASSGSPGAPSAGREISLVASYHPSRQNTQTGKLTHEMLDGVFTEVRRLLSEVEAGR